MTAQVFALPLTETQVRVEFGRVRVSVFSYANAAEARQQADRWIAQAVRSCARASDGTTTFRVTRAGQPTVQVQSYRSGQVDVLDLRAGRMVHRWTSAERRALLEATGVADEIRTAGR